MTELSASATGAESSDPKAAKRARKDQSRVGIGKFWAWQTRGISAAAQFIVLGFVMQFCTDVIGLSAATLGTLFLVSKVIDAVADLAWCWIVDNTRTRWGKGRPYEWAIVGLWITTILIFFTPVEWSDAWKYVWVTAMYVLANAVFLSLLNVGQAPYQIRAFSDNQAKIAKVSSLGAVPLMVGAMIVSITFPIAVRTFAGTPETGYSMGGWQMIVLAYGIPLALLGLLRFFVVKEDPAIDIAAGDSGVKVGDIVTCLKRNRHVWTYAGAYFASSLAAGLAVGTFYFTWVVGDLGVMGLLQALGVAVLPVMFAFPALLRRFSASRLILFGGLIGAVGFTINFFAQANLPLLAVGMMVAAVGQFPIAYLQILIIRQLADYNEHLALPRMDASVGMVASMAGQIAVGVGAWLMGLLLETSGYVGTAATQPDGALFMMRVIYGLLPAGCYLIMGFFATRMFSLDRLGPQIEAELVAKRAAAAPAGQESTAARG